MGNSEKKPAKARIEVSRELINGIPEGYKKGYVKTLRHNLFIHHDILLSEQQLALFFQNGYSSVADTIILTLKELVDSLQNQEKIFTEKLQTLEV